MMKYFFFFLISYVLIGCNDDFLQKYPPDQLTVETFWKSENDLATYSSTLYTIFPNKTLFWDDNQSDNYAPLLFNNIAAGLHTIPSGTWDWSYLKKCNYFLEHFSKVDVDDEIKKEYEAEVKFFRALYYHNRVKKFGDVPYVDKVINIGDDDILYGSRTPRNEVMEKVLEDLIFACENLPESREKGRIDKYSANHYKARVCLHEGTWRKYHQGSTDEKFLKEAVKSTEIIMNSNKFEIHNTGDIHHDYENLFIQQDLSSNKEMVFYKQYDAVLLPSYRYVRHIAVDINGMTKDLVEDYLCIDGKPIGLSSLYKGDLIYNNIFENRDARLAQTIVKHSIDGYFAEHEVTLPRLNVAKIGESLTLTGYHWKKFYSDRASSLFDLEDGDLPLARYAETLLIYAEAKAELNSLTQEDINNSLNQIRARAGVKPLIINQLERDPNSDMTSSAGFLDDEVSILIEEIRRERRIELVGEGFRYDDMMRWKAGKFFTKPVLGAKWSAFENMVEYNGDKIYDDIEIGKDLFLTDDGYIDVYFNKLPNNQRNFDSNKHYLFPIPKTEISLNPNLKQNPGW